MTLCNFSMIIGRSPPHTLTHTNTHSLSRQTLEDEKAIQHPLLVGSLQGLVCFHQGVTAAQHLCQPENTSNKGSGSPKQRDSPVFPKLQRQTNCGAPHTNAPDAPLSQSLGVLCLQFSARSDANKKKIYKKWGQHKPPSEAKQPLCEEN